MSKVYDKLLIDSPEMLICYYGTDGKAIGMRGERSKIDLMHNLFCNFAPETSKQYKEPKLGFAGNLAFISMTLERAKEAIRLYIYLNLLLSKEVESISQFDEETGEYQLEQDEQLANEIAIRESDLFALTFKTESFIAS